MIYFLFTSVAIMFIVSYYLDGRDFFAPSTMQILTFAGSIFMCIYFMLSMNCPHEFHWKTIILILTAMALSMMLGIGIHFMLTRIKVCAHTPESVRISPISNWASLAVLSIIVISIIWLLVEIRRIGDTSGDFFATMVKFHSIHSYSTEEIGRFPWLLNQLINLINVIFVLYGFNLIRFFKDLMAWDKVVNLLIIGLCILTLLLTGGRGYVVYNLIAFFIMFHLLRVQRQLGYKPYPFKFLVRMAAFLVLILVVFFIAKNFVGRNSKNEEMNLADYISYYVGTVFITLDEYLQNPPVPSSIFGKETFYNLNRFLINYGIIDMPLYLVHLEFRPVGAGYSTNVYTFLRSYHFDFGLVGTYIFHVLSIVSLSVFYEYVKKKRGNMGILIFSMMYYSIVLSFFAERFFSTIVSVGFVKLTVELLILYQLLIRKRIRLRLSSHHLSPGDMRVDA